MLHVHNNRHTYRYNNKCLQVVYALELACEDLPKLSDVCPEMHLKLDQRSAASPAALPSPDAAAATLSARRTPRRQAASEGVEALVLRDRGALDGTLISPRARREDAAAEAGGR